MKLRLSATMRREWEVRCIADVIPGLDGWRGELELELDERTAGEIARDCRFYMDPRCIDASAGERAAYRALLRQVE